MIPELATIPVESATQRKRFDRLSTREQIRALADIVGAIQRAIPRLEHAVGQVETVARQVIQSEMAQIHALRADAVKVLEALMSESAKHRQIVNEATEKTA